MIVPLQKLHILDIYPHIHKLLVVFAPAAVQEIIDPLCLKKMK